MENITLVYNYNPETKEYVGSSPADKSPLESNVYLVPANATLNIPELTTGENQCLVFDEVTSTWSIVPDFRGYVYYILGSTEELSITELNTLPPEEHLTEQPTMEKGEDELLNEFQIERAKHLEVVDGYQKVLVWEELSEENQELVRVYRRKILDIPKQSLSDVVWPTLDIIK